MQTGILFYVKSEKKSVRVCVCVFFVIFEKNVIECDFAWGSIIYG